MQQSSVARQVFLEATPTVNVSESEAKAVEDIPATSADEENEEERREERVATPPPTEPVILEENESVPNHPVIDQTEVETTGASTNTNAEANDTIMAEDHVDPEDNMASEANVESKANVVPEAQVQPEATVHAEATVPSPRPHTIEQAFDHGQLVTVKWPVMVPPTAPGPQYDYHVEQRPQVQKPKPRLPRLLGVATSLGSFSVNSFRAHNTFFDSAKNPYSKPKISSDRFWSYQQRSYYSCVSQSRANLFSHASGL